MTTFSAKRVGVSIGAAALVFAVSSAQAGSAPADLTVNAQVSASCTISTTTLDFGAYDPVVTNAATAKTGTGGVTIACTKGVTPTIGLANGTSYDSGSGKRQMANGTERLKYDLYQPVAGACTGTTPWGENADVYAPGLAASKAARSFVVCGSIPGGQDVGTGSYADTVVATVNF